MDKKMLRAEIRERKAAMTPPKSKPAAGSHRQALACPMFRRPSVYGYPLL